MNDSASLFDSNVWVALTFAKHPHHGAAEYEFARVGVEHPAVFCRATQMSFLRLATTPALLKRYDAEQMANTDALNILNGYLARQETVFRDEPPNTLPLWHKFAARGTASPKVWMDAYLAAFAIAGRFTLVTIDTDFEPYRGEGLDLRLIATA